ncbi:Leucine-rich repeat-containing protein 15 [Nymphon striatum]|nr:Leucine-rich repeat-containing protein 15 [Nymphon striatum]
MEKTSSQKKVILVDKKLHQFLNVNAADKIQEFLNDAHDNITEHNIITVESVPSVSNFYKILEDNATAIKSNFKHMGNDKPGWFDQECCIITRKISNIASRIIVIGITNFKIYVILTYCLVELVSMKYLLIVSALVTVAMSRVPKECPTTDTFWQFCKCGPDMFPVGGVQPIDVTCYKLDQKAFEEIMHSLKNVLVMRMTIMNSYIEKIKPSVTVNTQFISFTLHNVAIDYIGEGAFGAINDLQELYFIKMSLKKIPDFTNATMLTSLWIQDHAIVKVKKSDFIHLTNLQKLYIHRGHLEEVENETFFPLVKMESLVLVKNFLKKLPDVLTGPNSVLNDVQLDDTMLSSLPDNVFKNNQKMESLTLEANLFRSVPFKPLINLLNGGTEVYMGRNKIKCDTSLCWIPKLIANASREIQLFGSCSNATTTIDLELCAMERMKDNAKKSKAKTIKNQKPEQVKKQKTNSTACPTFPLKLHSQNVDVTPMTDLAPIVEDEKRSQQIDNQPISKKEGMQKERNVTPELPKSHHEKQATKKSDSQSSLKTKTRQKSGECISNLEADDGKPNYINQKENLRSNAELQTLSESDEHESEKNSSPQRKRKLDQDSHSVLKKRVSIKVPHNSDQIKKIKASLLNHSMSRVKKIRNKSNSKAKQAQKIGVTPCKNMIVIPDANDDFLKSRVVRPKRQRRTTIVRNLAEESVLQEGVLLDTDPWDVNGERKKSEVNELDVILDIISQTYTDLSETQQQKDPAKTVAKNYCQFLMKKCAKQIQLIQDIKKCKQEFLQEKSRIKKLDVEMNDVRQALIQKQYDIGKLEQELNSSAHKEKDISDFLIRLGKA